MQVLAFRPTKLLRLLAAWDDVDLLAALSQSNEGAFAEIYRRYGLLLLEQASRKAGSREAAEEIVQDIFTALWLRREHAASIQKLPEYLSTAVKFRVINLIKNRYTHEDYVAYCRATSIEADLRTENELATADLTGALYEGLAHLPDYTREIFQLSRFEHQTVPEIASRLKLTPKAVEYHITRALKLLRVSLKDFLLVLLLSGV
ncbi:RNA polymerase sigma-70 factor [Hymenobacter glaciei]|uniref:RNA polymerase sigma-70 factor n=1 Tax=Hymenobacter glaciei TaxID=877209 RepID=A0ABP7TU58_9BACT